MESTTDYERRRHSLLLNTFSLVAWVALAYSAALSGIVFMPGEWYQGLSKPSWNPPNWIFGPVWTTLYLMMGVSAWLIWRRTNAKPALAMFLLQLALNAAWTPVFFGLKQPGAAFLIILAMWCAIIATIGAFWPRSRAAACLLFPYLAWVTFASALNFALWQLN